MRPIAIAVIGTGTMARLMLPTLRATPLLHVATVASADAARGSAFAAAFGIPRHATLAEICADPAIDAVYVANATADHAATGIAALRAGKAVLCEKPFATSPDEAERIVAAARAAGRPLLEAIATPFLPAILAARDMLVAGGIGSPVQFTADFGYPASRAAMPRLFAGPGSGVLLDRAVYPLALALQLLGPVAKVTSSVTREDGVDVHAAIMLEHESGAISQLAASLTALLSNRATLSGTRGAIAIGAPLLKAESLRVSHGGELGAEQARSGLKARLAAMPALRRAKDALAGLRASHHPYGANHYAPEVGHFLDMIRDGLVESPILPHATSLAIQRIVAECR